jgi:spore coat protein CotH
MNLLFLLACEPVAAPDDAVGDVPPEIVADPWVEALYDPRTLKEIRLEVATEGEDALRVDPREYVEATLVVDGERVEGVGLRLKGSSSFRAWDDKPSLKVKTDAFVDDQSAHGVVRFTLNNMIEDPAQGREVIAYTLWNEGGMVAPRCAYANVYVNDELFGLYALVESVDDAFLARRYADPDGPLWAANDSADLTPDSLAFFELKEGEDAGQLSAAAARLAEVGTDYYGGAGEVLDMDQFLGFLTWSILTGFEDGYPYHLNDYFLYADPDDDERLDWLPWGMDESFDTGWRWQWGREGTVGYNCAADEACLARLRDGVTIALDTYEQVDPGALAGEVFDLTEEAVQTDPRRPSSPAEVESARARLTGMIEGWPARVRTGMGL